MLQTANKATVEYVEGVGQVFVSMAHDDTSIGGYSKGIDMDMEDQYAEYLFNLVKRMN